jgi:hypothetical protein
MYALMLAILTFSNSSIHKDLCLKEQYEKAVAISKFVKHDNEYWFWQAVANYKLGNKSEAISAINNFLHPLGQNPPKQAERHIVLAEGMLAQLNTWKDNDLADISRDMDRSERRLRIGAEPKKTLEIQKTIITKLDKMIEDIEKQLQQASAGQQPKPNQQPRGAEDSNIIGEVGKGLSDKCKFIKSSETWGKMPEKEKLKAMESIKRVLPPHLQEVGEGYRNNLRKMGGK